MQFAVRGGGFHASACTSTLRHHKALLEIPQPAPSHSSCLQIRLAEDLFLPVRLDVSHFVQSISIFWGGQRFGLHVLLLKFTLSADLLATLQRQASVHVHLPITPMTCILRSALSINLVLMPSQPLYAAAPRPQTHILWQFVRAEPAFSLIAAMASAGHNVQFHESINQTR